MVSPLIQDENEFQFDFVRDFIYWCFVPPLVTCCCWSEFRRAEDGVVALLVVMVMVMLVIRWIVLLSPRIFDDAQRRLSRRNVADDGFLRNWTQPVAGAVVPAHSRCYCSR